MYKLVINIILILIFITGITGWVFVNIIFDNQHEKRMEIPLSDVGGVVVDNEKNIYISDHFHGVIQIYNKNGKYIKNWDVKRFGGGYYMQISESDSIIIYPWRSSVELIYNKDGELVCENIIEGIEDSLFINQKLFYDSTGNKYELKKFPYPHVLLNDKIIVKQNILFKLVSFPQCMVVSILCFILLVVINFRLMQKLSLDNTSEERWLRIRRYLALKQDK
jgi:hypothetical protein